MDDEADGRFNGDEDDDEDEDELEIQNEPQLPDSLPLAVRFPLTGHGLSPKSATQASTSASSLGRDLSTSSPNPLAQSFTSDHLPGLSNLKLQVAPALPGPLSSIPSRQSRPTFCTELERQGLRGSDHLENSEMNLNGARDESRLEQDNIRNPRMLELKEDEVYDESIPFYPQAPKPPSFSIPAQPTDLQPQ